MVTKTTMSLALMLSVALSQAGGMEVPSLRSSKLATLRLIHENKSFRVMDAGKSQEVPACWVDKEVRSVSTERLAKMLGHGYLSVNKMSNGEFSVKSSVRGEGGGPVLAGILYGSTKAICYGVLLTAAAASAIATGGAAGGAIGIGVAGAGTAIGATGTAVVGATIAATGTTAAAGAATGATLAAAAGSAGGVAAVVGTIETLATFMGVLGMGAPTI